MIIKQMIIKNFRNIKSADLKFGKYSLFVGANNVGKSTILEALDLILGPDRLNSLDAINEHDFYKSEYLDNEGNVKKIEIECRLIKINDRQKRFFHNHLEYWDSLNDEYIPMSNLPEDSKNIDENHFNLDCLRLKFEGYYDDEDDEFLTKTFFLNPISTDSENEEKYDLLTKKHKREIGYLFLRFLRTGSRALSLERGSLLDIILKLKEIKSSSWNKILSKLKGLGSDLDNDIDFRKILDEVEERVQKYTPLVSEEKKSTKFEITNLTRKNLRQSLNLFIGTEPSDFLVPYKNVGNGTINILLFALMTFIADTKIEADKNVIFAMEEPEIAIPPYTQRRITETLFKISNQIFITSHSPYISEKFLLEDILVLENRDGILISNRVNNDLIKEKILRRDFRNRFAEGIMSRGILAVEGISDDLVLHYISEKLDKWKDDYISLDILGITIVNNEGSGNINKLGQFFKSLNIKTYAFYDEGTDIDDKFFNIAKNNRYKGLEELIVEETPIIKLMEFLLACEKFPDCPKFEIGNDSKKKVCEILKKRKAEGYSVKLLEFCTCEEHFPNTIVKFLRDINDDFSK